MKLAFCSNLEDTHDTDDLIIKDVINTTTTFATTINNKTTIATTNKPSIKNTRPSLIRNKPTSENQIK